MKLVVIIPTYQEKDTIARIISEVMMYMPHADVLVVDDNSPDGTQDIVRGIQTHNTHVHLLPRAGKEGLGKAYMHALQYVLDMFAPERVVMMDADMSHHPRYLPQMEVVLENGAYVVVGSRYIPQGDTVGWETWRKLLSKYGNLYARTITGIPIHDLTAGFYMIDGNFLHTIDLNGIDASGYAFQIELKNALWQGTGRRFGSIVELPIVFGNRIGGESKISNHIIREGIIAPWRIRFKK